MNRQQMTNLIGAGTITGVLLLIAFLFGGGPRIGNAQAAQSSPQTVQIEAAPQDAAPQDAATLAQQNAELRQAVDTLLAREQQYADQLQQANDALAQQAAPAGEYGYEEDEEHEEYEEYEDHEEHEAYEEHDE